MTFEVVVGDCREVMRGLGADSIDAIVTDPPYDLTAGKKGGTGEASLNVNSPAGRSRISTGGGFMGKQWDATGIAFDPATWVEALRVLKPGGHLLAFGGTRTYHRMTCAIEDAGFEIRDCVAWLYGSGFPKSLDVSKAIDKAAGAEREVVGERVLTGTAALDGRQGRASAAAEMRTSNGAVRTVSITAPATDLAARWQGFGTALKPAWESIVLARKPHTLDTERRIIVANLERLEEQLWSLLPVSGADSDSTSSRVAQDAAFDSALWSADLWRSTQDALSALTDTSRCESAIRSSLSIVSSWRASLDGLCDPTNTYTIGTAFDPTTDLRILRSLVSAVTPLCIIQDAMNRPGTTPSALPVARYFAGVESRLAITRELTALARATSPEPTGIEPAFEPIVVARKPLVGTVAANVERHGTGALNIDGCRIGEGAAMSTSPRGGIWSTDGEARAELVRNPLGRWPANVALDEDAAAMLDAQTGERKSGKMYPTRIAGDSGVGRSVYGKNAAAGFTTMETYGDTGGASRFYYVAKASRSERNAGLDGMPERDTQQYGSIRSSRANGYDASSAHRNHHPTVKPIALMRWLVRLVTPPGGLVFDPFLGSGSTGCAAALDAFGFLGCDLDPEYAEIARRRIEHHATLAEKSRDAVRQASTLDGAA